MSAKRQKLQLAKLVGKLTQEQELAAMGSLPDSESTVAALNGTLRKSKQAAFDTLLAALVSRRVRAALEGSEEALGGSIKGVLNARIRDGQQVTSEMLNLMLARINGLEETCALLAQALVEILHPTKSPPKNGFHSSARPANVHRS